MFKLARSLALLVLLCIAGSATAQFSPEPTFEPFSWNSVQKKNRDGTVSTAFHAKFVNYVNENREWEKIDLTPNFVGNGWVVDKTPYRLLLPLFADEAVSFESTNAFDVVTKSFRQDESISKLKKFTGAAHIEGVVMDDGILYQGALAIGDVLYQQHEEEFRAIVKINAPPSVCNDPKEEVRIPFTEEYSGGLQPKNKGVNIGATKKNVGDGYVVASSEFRKIVTKQARAWDSRDEWIDIAIEGRFVNGEFKGEKVIPCDFLLSASYPVFTDTTTTVRPDASPESATVDGRVTNSCFPGTWSACQGASAGNGAADSATTAQILSDSSASDDFTITRAIFLFDTSGIPDTDVISAATLMLNGTAKVNTDNDGTDYITIVSSNPASNTAVVTGDFDLVGDAIDNPTKLSDDIDLGSLSGAGQNTWTFNAAGIAAISKTSISKFGGREGHDLTDSQITDSTQNSLTFTTADETGTTNDPTLTVTHAAVASSTPVVIWFSFIDLLDGVVPTVFAK